MLRTRDLFAALGLLWLTKSAYFKSANNAASSSNNLSASLRLAFYLPRSKSSTLFPEVFDVDGDGTPEALAVITNTSPTSSPSTYSWSVQILDLRQFKSTTSFQRPYPATAPFQPKKLIETNPENAVTGQDSVVPNGEDEHDVIPLIPLVMTTGQVLKSKEDSQQQQQQMKQTTSKSGDKTDRYFCGSDWHDAANKCATHCPSGQSSECPESERCFADTPCSAHEQQQLQQQQSSSVDYEKLHTTPAGGWPSIFTAFSQGIVTMHSLTAEHDEEPQQQQKKKQALQVKRMWQVNPLLKKKKKNSKDDNATPGDQTIAAIEWEDVAITFVDAVSSSSTNGLLVVAGSATAYYQPSSQQDKEADQDDDDDEERTIEFVVALDALTGRTIWQSLSEDLYKDDGKTSNGDKELPLPFSASRGTTSAARRRSLIPQHATTTTSSTNNRAVMGVSSANCMREYRRSLLTSSTGGALPHQYWGAADDTVVTTLHFDHQGGGVTKAKQPGSSGKPATASITNAATTSRRKQTSSHSRWWPGTFSGASKKHRGHKHHHRHDSLVLGRPNVIVTHNYQGIQVRALKNGQPLCHVSLEDHTVYHDINHDGTLDSLQIVTSSNALMDYAADDDEVAREQDWVQNLARRVRDLNQKQTDALSKINDAKSPRLVANAPLCHLLALSGLPTKEELFSVNLCGPYFREQQQQLQQEHEDIVGAPLLIVEPSTRGGSRSGYDVVAAVNTGTISRVRGTTGRRIFQENGRRLNPDFPMWERPENVLLSRIESPNSVPFARPIVLAGENSAVLLSAMTGNVLASATFPQLASRSRRPRLVDLNGDGTTDLLVYTTDAVWGYQIVVRTGATVFYRLSIGLLLIFMMIALLRNKFGPHPGKRSMDI